MKKIAFMILAALTLTACSGSTQNAWQKTATDYSRADFKVTLYSGGQVIRTWDLKNTFVNDEDQSGMVYFFDTNGKMVRLTGDVVIEQQ